MGARIVTKQEFYYIKEKLAKDTRAGSNVQRVAKAVKRSPETVRMINKYANFGSYTRRRVLVIPKFAGVSTAELNLDRAESLAFRHSELKRKVDAQGRWLTVLVFVTIGIILALAL